MAYDKEEIYQQALDICERNKLFYVQDVVELLGLSSSTFYEYFPSDSAEMANIKRKINESKAKVRVATRKKLLDSKTAAALIALLKIVGTDQERIALTQATFDTNDNDKLEKILDIIIEAKKNV